MDQVLKLFPSNTVRATDTKATMNPGEIFENKTATTDYAINALSRPNDDTYRKNLARYLDTKGFDLVSKDRQLYIGDRNSMNMKPVTKNFLGDMIGSSPELAGSITGGIVGFGAGGPVGAVVGATAGSVGGDAVQQLINSYFLGEQLTTGERALESGKSAMLGGGGEFGGQVIGRIISPLRGIDKTTQVANETLSSKYDIPLTPATATGHEGLANFEEVMSKGTLGGKQIVQMKDAEVEGVENLARDLLENKMGATGNTYDSGASFAYNVDKKQKLAQDFFTNRYGELVETAGITEIPIVSLRGVAQHIVDQADKIPAFKNGIDKLAQRLLDSPGSLTYQEYQQLRSFIGSKIKDASITGQSGSKAAYKQLYNAINNDFDEVFKGTSMWNTKKLLDHDFKTKYKEPFEDPFTRGVAGSGRNQVDAERIGGLIANSSGKAKTAMNTADLGVMQRWQPGGIMSVADTLFDRKPYESMKTAADYVLGKSTAANGGLSLAKTRTNLKKATGIDMLLKKSDRFTEEGLVTMKGDLIKLIELSGANNKVANKSGTAWMNEMIRMKNDPVSALIGFFSDQSIAKAYKNKTIQKWLTNDIINTKEAQQLINAMTQTGVRAGHD